MNSKKELWLLLAAFVLPIMSGTMFFYLNPNYFTQNTVNYGQFISPVITTNQQDIVFSAGSKGRVRGIWSLAYFTDQCDKACNLALAEIKTVRLLMNDEMRRLQPVILLKNNANSRADSVLMAKVSETLAQKLNQFPDNTIFLIDPIGNILLHYNAQNLNIKWILKDLNRLFKYSRIG